jgi:tetratricopeptide (TPR) repeat protein
MTSVLTPASPLAPPPPVMASPPATATIAARADLGPRRQLGAAWSQRVAGLHVLKLKGSFREMGYQHGRLLREEIPTGPIPYYRTYSEKLLGRTVAGRAAPYVWPAISRLLGGRVARGLPDFALETVRGLAEGAGVPYERLLEGCTMPDSLLWLSARMMQLRPPGPAVAHRLALGLGCTSAIAWGGATRDGRLMHARNLDYHGVSTWPSTAAVLFHEPEQGQRYVSVAAAGVALGGVTAMNQSGLSLTVHQHMFTERTRLGGTPVGVVGDEIMRHARDLDDATRILDDHTPIGCWTYLLTDARRRQVLCYEVDPERRIAHRLHSGQETFGYANIYLDEELGQTEVNLYGSYWRHNQGRYRRVNELLAAGRGALDAQAMAAIIGDPGDPRCRVRDSIAMVMTVGSVVFRPEDGQFWVGTGEAPTSRGRFVPFSLATEQALLDGPALQVGNPDSVSDRAFELFRQAYVAYVDRHDLDGTAELLERARSLAPEQAVYHQVAGLVLLEAGQAQRALPCFEAAARLGHPDAERVAGFELWRGRCLDVLGRRAEAITAYRRAVGHRGDRPVDEAACQGLRRPYDAARARRLTIEFSLGDVVTP